jgi:hypothetical protein
MVSEGLTGAKGCNLIWGPIDQRPVRRLAHSPFDGYLALITGITRNDHVSNGHVAGGGAIANGQDGNRNTKFRSLWRCLPSSRIVDWYDPRRSGPRSSPMSSGWLARFPSTSNSWGRSWIKPRGLRLTSAVPAPVALDITLSGDKTTRDEAKTIVNKIINEGCPPSRTTARLTEFLDAANAYRAELAK